MNRVMECEGILVSFAARENLGDAVPPISEEVQLNQMVIRLKDQLVTLSAITSLVIHTRKYLGLVAGVFESVMADFLITQVHHGDIIHPCFTPR